MKKLIFLPFFILLTAVCTLLSLFFICEKQTHSPIVARVGKSVLTLDDLFKRIPPEYSDRITREQMINYVKQWMDTELLYQEAIRQKINHEKEIRERLEKMKKDLLSAEMISRNSISSGNNIIPQPAIEAYYEANKESFIRETDVVKYIEIVVEDLKSAWNVRNMVTTDNFLDLAVRFSKVPVQDPRSVSYISIDMLPQEMADVISNIRVSGTTAPFNMSDGYHIIRILDKQKAGTTSMLEEVRDDIIGILSTDAQKKDIETLLSNLRLKMDYEFHFDLIPSNRVEQPSQTDTFNE